MYYGIPVQCGGIQRSFGMVVGPSKACEHGCCLDGDHDYNALCKGTALYAGTLVGCASTALASTATPLAVVFLPTFVAKIAR
mmetsp:Transcript_19575/g.33743  ORF Transcript_19575/g.33743 Transcript_19575/m.33743 type:complete len:82 (+) Transcript_19575:29-274(+)